MPKNMKYDEVSAKAGSGKKKGGAKHYEKGAAETIKQEKKDLKKNMEGGMKNAGDVPGKKEGGAKHYGKDHGKKGGAKYKEGAGDYDVKKGSHDHPHGGPGRLGFTQNFGPARQNSYARGAAKVAKIMGRGAADHIAGHPKPAEIKLKDPKIPASSVTDFQKQDVIEFLKDQEQYDKNTTQVTQNLAELDSLKKVAQGKSKLASTLYGPKYDSSKSLTDKHIPNSGDNRLGQWKGYYNMGLGNDQRENIAKLTKEAKKIQGPRPTLD